MPPVSEHARAIVLATAINSVAPSSSVFPVELDVPAVYAVAPRAMPRLDLDAPVFRYRVGADQVIRPLRGTAPFCTKAHRTRRRHLSPANDGASCPP